MSEGFGTRPPRPPHVDGLVGWDWTYHSGHGATGLRSQLTRYDEKGWRATFYTTGMEHSPTSATGTAWEPTPWHATQRAAWDSLRRISEYSSS
jgi:hypothetical protein